MNLVTISSLAVKSVRWEFASAASLLDTSPLRLLAWSVTMLWRAVRCAPIALDAICALLAITIQEQLGLVLVHFALQNV